MLTNVLKWISIYVYYIGQKMATIVFNWSDDLEDL